MFMDDPYIFSTVITAVLAISIFILALTKQSQSKALANEIKRKELALAEKSIEEIVQSLEITHKEISEKLSKGTSVFNQLKEKLQNTQNQIKHVDVGLLPPTYKFDDRESLKKQIAECFEEQFKVIKNGNATSAHSKWKWFGSKRKGMQMINTYRNLLLKAFNAEFDFIRKKMRHSSYDTAINKLYRLDEQLEKLGETTRVSISNTYLNLKLKELSIWHSELQHREDLKQEKIKQQALLRQQAMQSGDDADEIEDELYYKKSDLKKAQKLAQEMHGESVVGLEQKIARIQEEIAQLESKFERAISQAQITKAGYIYVISNIGSFGEGVIKIGMTRRLEPLDRVNELGDASVPFKFDVHTLTFVENAPKIEKILHRKFESRRVNVENFRKEFFKVSPKEVAEVMEELKIDCDWYFDVEAKEYRESLLIRAAQQKYFEESEVFSEQLPAFI